MWILNAYLCIYPVTKEGQAEGSLWILLVIFIEFVYFQLVIFKKKKKKNEIYLL